MVLKSIISFFVVVLFLSSCSETAVEEKVDVPAPTINGKALFTLNCASCHGADGKLGLSGAKDITQTKLGDDEIRLLIENGKNGMPSFKELLSKPGEIDAVINHLSTLKTSK